MSINVTIFTNNYYHIIIHLSGTKVAQESIIYIIFYQYYYYYILHPHSIHDK
jgi:hypothetical protein